MNVLGGPQTPPYNPQAEQTMVTAEQKAAMEKLKNMGEQASTGAENGSEGDLPF
jgi:hypothetical protein